MEKMNKYKLPFFLTILFLRICTSCGNPAKLSDDSLIEFDVTRKYPPKTLDIQDVADVEYLVLATRDSFLYTHFVYLTDNEVVGFNSSDWSFVFFDRKGNPVSRIGKSGGGPEEYMPFWIQVYDEQADEFFVFSYPNKIQVYNSRGDYKRTLPLSGGGGTAVIDAMYTYNEDYLLCHDKLSATNPFFLLSKKEGRVENIPLSFEKKINPFLKKKGANGEFLTIQFPYSYAIREEENLLLTEYSCDTFFLYTPEHRLVPKFVRKPSVRQMEPTVLVHGLLQTSLYTFWATDELTYNFATRQGGEGKNYLLDKQSNAIYEVKIMNRDYEGQELSLSPATVTSKIGESSSNPKVGVCTLKNGELLTARDEGRLSGPLKAIVDSMEEETPFVLMIMKFK